jgi:hypothetical protein
LFLRQLQLSIDRSLDDWTGLVGYLSSKTPIETSTGTVTVWNSLKPFKIDWLFQMTALSK